MTNDEKRELRKLCKEGRSFEYIRSIVDCADSTIRRYMKVFSNKGGLNGTGKIDKRII